MEEIELTILPEKEQVSDDFGLYTDGETFYAIRTKTEEDKLSFCIGNKSKWIAISNAVSAIEFYILRSAPDRKPFIPVEFVNFYPKETNDNNS